MPAFLLFLFLLPFVEHFTASWCLKLLGFSNKFVFDFPLKNKNAFLLSHNTHTHTTFDMYSHLDDIYYARTLLFIGNFFLSNTKLLSANQGVYNWNIFLATHVYKILGKDLKEVKSIYITLVTIT